MDDFDGHYTDLSSRIRLFFDSPGLIEEYEAIEGNAERVEFVSTRLPMIRKIFASNNGRSEGSSKSKHEAKRLEKLSI